jgi:hypothetical protein
MNKRTLITVSGWVVAGCLWVALKKVSKENKTLLSLHKDYDTTIRMAQQIVWNHKFNEIINTNNL